jgi:hypothetical protein
MMVRYLAALLVAAWALAMAGVAAQPMTKDRCETICEKLEQQCQFSGTRAPVCASKWHVCFDSCVRTGRPIHF